MDEQQINELENEVKRRTVYSNENKEKEYQTDYHRILTTDFKQPQANIKSTLQNRRIEKYKDIKSGFSKEDNDAFLEKIKNAKDGLIEEYRRINSELNKINDAMKNMNKKYTQPNKDARQKNPSILQKAYTKITGNPNNFDIAKQYFDKHDELKKKLERIKELLENIYFLIFVYKNDTKPEEQGGNRKSRRNRKGKSKTRKNSKKSNRRR